MERIKEKITSFEYKGMIAIILILGLISGVLFVERSGIQYRYNRVSLEFMPDHMTVSKAEALEGCPETCLVLYASDSTESMLALEQFRVILTDMKVGHSLVDLSKTQEYTFDQYKTAVLLLSNLSLLGNKLMELDDWVYHGGGALLPLTLAKESYSSVMEAKFGISEASYGYAIVDSIYIEEGFMIGGGQGYAIMDGYDSGLALQLADTEAVTVHAYTNDARKLPLIWESAYGEGKFVLNNFGIYTKNMRGFFSASYSLLEDTFVYPVINGSAFYLDDFPSQIPSGSNTYIWRDYGATIRDFYINIWWPDMINLADKYGLKYTGLAIECYSDAVDGTVDAAPDKGTFLNLGSMLLRMGGEIGYHGYNHQPLCFDNCDYAGLYDYRTWESYGAMQSAFDELMDLCDALFPGVDMQVYVPPSNLLSVEGRGFLTKEYPHIRSISGIYFEDDNLDFACIQEFDVAADGIVDQPRIISGCDMDAFMQLAAVSELNFHYVNSHFTHPDDALDPDRGAELGWEELSSRFDGYLNWLYSSAPNIRDFTGSEMAAAVQRFAAVTTSVETSETGLTITLGNFHDEAQLMVRFNDKKPKTVDGGTLEQLTDTLYLLQAQSSTVTITYE